MADQLTERQEAFCQHYVNTLNGAKSARLAGYSEEAAKEQASRLLTDVNIQDKISELRKYVADKYNATRERIVQEYARIAFFDVRNIYLEDGGLKSPVNLSDDEAAVVSGVEVEEIRVEGVSVGQTKKVKIVDKKGALDSLTKMLGYNAPDKTQLTGKDDEPLFATMSDDKLLSAIQSVLQKANG